MLCLHRLHLDYMSFYSQSGCVQPGLYIWAIFHRIFVEGQEFLSGTVDGLSAFVEWNIEPLIITICGWCLVGTVYDPIHDNIPIQDGGLCRCHRERGKHFIFFAFRNDFELISQILFCSLNISELSAVSSDRLSGRGVEISLHSSYLVRCCRRKRWMILEG